MSSQLTAIRRALFGAATAGLFLLPAGALAASPGQAKKLTPREVMHDTSQPLGVLAATLPARDFSAYTNSVDGENFISFSKP